jgi:hypothetical protein
MRGGKMTARAAVGQDALCRLCPMGIKPTASPSHSVPLRTRRADMDMMFSILAG